MSDTDDLITWLTSILDEDEAWAVAASQTSGRAPEGGEHWRWERTDNDQPVTPDPATEEYLAEADDVGLRSVEQYPTTAVGPLPSMLLASAEVSSSAAGHIVRHDPAAVLADIAAKRRIVRDISVPVPFVDIDSPPYGIWIGHVLRILASAYADRPGYRQEWAP